MSNSLIQNGPSNFRPRRFSGSRIIKKQTRISCFSFLSIYSGPSVSRTSSYFRRRIRPFVRFQFYKFHPRSMENQSGNQFSSEILAPRSPCLIFFRKPEFFWRMHAVSPSYKLYVLIFFRNSGRGE